MSNFPPTIWIDILNATVHGDTAAAKAWELFYRRYENVLRSIIAGWIRPNELDDTVQDFMLHLMEGSTLRKADPKRGRFRDFLRKVLKHYLLMLKERSSALKRGRLFKVVPLDEESEQIAGNGEWGPEEAFDVEWAFSIFAEARRQMESEPKDEERFAVLSQFLPGSVTRLSADEAAKQLNLSQKSFDTAVSRIKQKWGQCVRKAVAVTVSRPDEVSEEVSFLCRCIIVWQERQK